MHDLIWYFLLIINTASIVGWAALLTWGISLTIRQGLPSISRMLNDDENLTIFFIVLITGYGVNRFLTTLLYIFYRLDEAFLIACIATCGFLEILFLILVGFLRFVILRWPKAQINSPLRVDENLTGHLLVTGAAVGFGLLREILLVWFRHRIGLVIFCGAKVKDPLVVFLLWLNIFVIVAAVALGISYFLINLLGTQDIFIGGIEYELFALLVSLPIWQFLDVMQLSKPSPLVKNRVVDLGFGWKNSKVAP